MSFIVLTGGAGVIGTALRERLPSRGWTVRPFDRVPTPDGVVGDTMSPADLDAALAGADAVVHLAAQRTEAPWSVIRESNIEGTFQVFDAARRAGVARVVYASSVHAVGFTPIGADQPADLPPRPDTLYGVSKVVGEALGRYYADRYGMRVACLRIGAFEDRPSFAGSLAIWLSPDDCARLVDACLRAPALEYAIVWGISNNTRRTVSLDAGRALGYEPRDDAEAYAADVDQAPHPSDAFLGAGFTSAGFGIDEVAARW
ncbi:MAG TPA: NAD(P)-dependent oxidoreductase [Jatrophihabitans sp.]|jgi:uronate dehydrogenase|nr:NAD(P)-dependent oxidoreductase [Jatrophihabitans sp.]